jgi:hypothetical protein
MRVIGNLIIVALLGFGLVLVLGTAADVRRLIDVGLSDVSEIKR